LIPLTNDEVEFYAGSNKYVKNSNSYIGQLKATFKDSRLLQNEIEKAAFTPKSLIRITKQYHEEVVRVRNALFIKKLIRPKRINLAFQLEFLRYLSDLSMIHFILN